jgi:hypothetical protein
MAARIEIAEARVPLKQVQAVKIVVAENKVARPALNGQRRGINQLAACYRVHRDAQ